MNKLALGVAIAIIMVVVFALAMRSDDLLTNPELEEKVESQITETQVTPTPQTATTPTYDKKALEWCTKFMQSDEEKEWEKRLDANSEWYKQGVFERFLGSPPYDESEVRGYKPTFALDDGYRFLPGKDMDEILRACGSPIENYIASPEGQRAIQFHKDYAQLFKVLYDAGQERMNKENAWKLGEITTEEYIAAITNEEEKIRKVNEILESSDIPEEYKTSTQYFRLANDARLRHLMYLKMYIVASEQPNADINNSYILMETALDHLKEAVQYMELAQKTRP